MEGIELMINRKREYFKIIKEHIDNNEYDKIPKHKGTLYSIDVWLYEKQINLMKENMNINESISERKICKESLESRYRVSHEIEEMNSDIDIEITPNYFYERDLDNLINEINFLTEKWNKNTDKINVINHHFQDYEIVGFSKMVFYKF